ncbi:hypothetical protein Esi_0219_0029 [Ectocarpus siliculosus]|uniref:Uncharacterized protein n=1 Tax=Ectocarpus siliculosus TaxID=2880 RepID=D7FRT6_ECTSI|nr:hypothetical protein Esi_0219_0029 [Ectocarpus siliculosus]|eukprot:CBJ30877.1 hypothetical protein Esi_0219_0029 [Ectocarpus siliculosus]
MGKVGSALNGCAISIGRAFTKSAAEWPINGIDGTRAIGLSFIGLAYFLHPLVVWAYHRVRAYRAWRAIEKGRAVEVTAYSNREEILRGRGVWDATRIVTVLLVVFNVASWGLELMLDQYSHENEACPLTQPSPVYRKDLDNNARWQVLNLDEINGEDRDYNGSWLDLPNVSKTEAKSLYYVENFKRSAWSDPVEKDISGEIIVANWDPAIAESLSFSFGESISSGSYEEGTATAVVEAVNCSSSSDPLKDAPVYRKMNNKSEEWGRVVECEAGPRLANGGEQAQPAIILTQNGTNETHVIIEETTTFLSFLYSVWKTNGDSVTLTYAFHIASTVRLAEAVVTGIVLGESSGGGCFGMLRAFSRGPEPPEDEYAKMMVKALPFGENPQSGKVEKLTDVETIEAGIDINVAAMTCLVCVLSLTVVGIVWAVYLGRSTGMDIYDRDELIRAVSLQGHGRAVDLAAQHSRMRIFVRREDNGGISVAISDTGQAEPGGCWRFWPCKKVGETADPSPVADTVIQNNDDFGGASAPAGSRTVWLGGVRIGRARPFPGRDGTFTYPAAVSLSASPTPTSFAGGDLRSPPLQGGPQEPRRPNSFLPEGRGPSAFFESTSSFASGDDAGDAGDEVGSGDRVTGDRLFEAFGKAAPAPFDGGLYRSPLGRPSVPAAGAALRSTASSQSRP